jgi:hypothetical protein
MPQNKLSNATPQAFSRRAHQLLAEANRLCAELPDCDLDEWIGAAKRRGKSYVEGLDLAIARFKEHG